VRIALVGPLPPHRGGIAAHTQGLARALRSAGHRTEVVGFGRLYPHLLFPGRSEFEPTAAPTQDSSAGTLALLDVCRPATWWRTGRAIQAFAPDAVVVQWWHPIIGPALGVALAGLGSTTVVCIAHNAEPHDAFAASRFLSEPAYRLFSGALCHSRWVADRLRARRRTINVVCAPMPLLFEIDRTSTGDAGPRIPPWVAAMESRLVVFLGLLRPYKGVDLLIEAWGRADIPAGVRLLLAGESYLRRGRLRSMITACPRRDSIVVEDRYLSNAEFLGVLRAAELVVFPYRRASQSGLLPIASAVGKPMLVSDAGGLSEQVCDSDTVETFSAGDADSLVSALEHCVARRPRQRVGASRQEESTALPRWRVRTDNGRSWSRVVEALEGLIRRLH